MWCTRPEEIPIPESTTRYTTTGNVHGSPACTYPTTRHTPEAAATVSSAEDARSALFGSRRRIEIPPGSHSAERQLREVRQRLQAPHGLRPTSRAALQRRTPRTTLRTRRSTPGA